MLINEIVFTNEIPFINNIDICTIYAILNLVTDSCENLF